MKKTLLVLLFLLCAASAQAATMRYVDVNLASNCGGTYSFASRNCTGLNGDAYTAANINSALVVMSPGDTTRIRAGSGYTTSITFVPVCTVSASCVIMAETGETVAMTVNGIGINNTNSASAYVTFRDFALTCTGSGNECIGIQGNNLTFQNLTVNGNNTINTVVQLNAAAHHNTFTYGDYSNPVSGGYPFYIKGPHNIVERAKIHNFDWYGVHNYESGTTNPHHNTYRYNEIYDGCRLSFLCAGILLASGQSNVAHDNVIRGMTGSSASGIAFGPGATDTVVYNNTIINSQHACVSTSPSSSGAIFKNNICFGHTRNHYHDANPPADTSLVAFTSISNNRCDISQPALCATTASPGFANAGADDYTLAAGSAMIDAGVANIGQAPGGLIYTALSNGPAPDIGAFESIPFASASATTTSVLDITFGAAYAPLSTVASCANVTVRYGGVTKTCTSFANNGNATYRWTCAACLATTTTSSVTITWVDNSTNEDGFRVERNLNGGAYALLPAGTLGPNITTLVDTTLLASQTVTNTYCYRVYSFNAGGNSAAATTVTPGVTDCAPTIGIAGTGGVIDIAIAAGKFTDSIRIGGTLNQSSFALPTTTVTNNIGGTTEVFTVMGVRQRTYAQLVTATNASAWITAENAIGTVRVDSGKFSGWWLIGCTAANCPAVGFLFEQNLNAGSFANTTDSCATNPLCFDSTNSAAPHGTVIPGCLLTNSLGNCLAGTVAAQASSYPVLDLAVDQAAPIQANLAIKSGLSVGDRICVRPKLDSGAALTHSQTLCVDVANPAGSPS